VRESRSVANDWGPADAVNSDLPRLDSAQVIDVDTDARLVPVAQTVYNEFLNNMAEYTGRLLIFECAGAGHPRSKPMTPFLVGKWATLVVFREPARSNSPAATIRRSSVDCSSFSGPLRDETENSSDGTEPAPNIRSAENKRKKNSRDERDLRRSTDAYHRRSVVRTDGKHDYANQTTLDYTGLTIEDVLLIFGTNLPSGRSGWGGWGGGNEGGIATDTQASLGNCSFPSKPNSARFGEWPVPRWFLIR